MTTSAERQSQKIAGILDSYEVTATGSDTGLTLAEWLANFGDARGFGVPDDGATDARATLASMFTTQIAAGQPIFIPVPDTGYSLSSELQPAAGNLRMSIAPGTAFTGAELDFGDFFPYDIEPVFAQEMLYTIFDSSHEDYNNLFAFNAVARADLASVPVVALNARGIANTASASVFGANIAAIVDTGATGATAVGLEIDVHNKVDGATLTGLAIDAVGDYPSATGIVIQANSSTAYFNTAAIAVNSAVDEACPGSLFRAVNGTGARGIHFTGRTFTTSEWESANFTIGASVSSVSGAFKVLGGSGASPEPSFGVEGSASSIFPTYYSKGSGFHQFKTNGVSGQLQFLIRHTASAVNRLSVTGSATGAAPSVKAEGSDTNIDILLDPKGSGRLDIGYSGASASTPGNFSADNVIEVKLDGTTVYIPYMTSAW